MTAIHRKLDTDKAVFFYEQEFYVLSNFSSFRVLLAGAGAQGDFQTAEHAYHCHKFPDNKDVYDQVFNARSAHEAFRLAQVYKNKRRSDWDDVKEDIMYLILREKTNQHEYVKKKLLETGDRFLVEDSWRDNYWGWGEDHTGKNRLGYLWMELRKDYQRIARLEALRTKNVRHE